MHWGPQKCSKNHLPWQLQNLITYVLTYLLTHSLTHSLTHRSRVLLENLTGSQLVKKLPAFYGTFSLPHSQVPTTCPYPVPDQSSSWPPQPTSWRAILILSSHLCLGLPSGLFPQISPPKPCIHLSSPPYMLHAPPISFISIWSPE